MVLRPSNDRPSSTLNGIVKFCNSSRSQQEACQQALTSKQECGTSHHMLEFLPRSARSLGSIAVLLIFLASNSLHTFAGIQSACDQSVNGNHACCEPDERVEEKPSAHCAAHGSHHVPPVKSPHMTPVSSACHCRVTPSNSPLQQTPSSSEYERISSRKTADSAPSLLPSHNLKLDDREICPRSHEALSRSDSSPPFFVLFHSFRI